MPRIPIISASEQAATVQLPARVPVQDYTGAYNLGQQVSEFGGQLQNIATRLKEQQNTLDVADMASKFHTRLIELEAEARLETNKPLTRGKTFNEKATSAIQELASTAKNRLVAERFQVYAVQHLPVYQGRVNRTALEYNMEQQTVLRRDLQDTISLQAARTSNPAEWSAALTEVGGVEISPGVWQGGIIRNDPHLTPVAAQKEHDRFMDQAAKDRMDYLRRSDVDKLITENDAGIFDRLHETQKGPVITAAKNERAAAVSAAERKQEHFMNVVVKEQVERYLGDKAADGTLTPYILDDWSGFITSEKKRYYADQIRLVRSYAEDLLLGCRDAEESISSLRDQCDGRVLSSLIKGEII